MSSDDKKKPTNAQTALLDYYDEMLGSLSNDPLKELVKEERAAKMAPSSVIQNKRTYQAPISVERQYAPIFLKPTFSESKQSESRKKAPAKKVLPTFYNEAYEQKLKADILAPLIIPAAFPKLAPKPEAVVQKAIIPAKKLVLEAAATNTETTSKPVIDQSSVLDTYTEIQKKDVSIIAKSVSATEGSHDALEELPKNGRPVWAQERFECLLFSVAGLKLAVPLISLGAIYKIENDFTPLVGRASWFMGLYRHDDRNVRLVDTAQLVMPDRVVDTTRENYKYIIRLGGNNWGMACDSVQESISIEPEEIKWRTERSKRAWLSGTLIEHMCALIDVEALTDILKVEALSKYSSFKA